MNRVSIFHDETGSRKILQRCIRHRVCHRENDKRENFGEIYRRDGKWAKARRKDLAAGTQEREARKFNGKAGAISKLLHTPCTRNRVLFSNFIMDFLKRFSWTKHWSNVTFATKEFAKLVKRRNNDCHMKHFWLNYILIDLSKYVPHTTLFNYYKVLLW